MSRLDQANFWMIVGVALGFLLGACCVGFLVWLDRWCTRNFPESIGPSDPDPAIRGDYTVWGDSTTCDHDPRESRP